MFKGMQHADMGPTKEFPEPVIFIFTDGYGLDVQISSEVVRQAHANPVTMQGLIRLPEIVRDAISRVISI